MMEMTRAPKTNNQRKKRNRNKITYSLLQKILTGAMYSSVPTKEFDALIGSAIKIGVC